MLLDLDGTTVASKGDALPSLRNIKAVAEARQHITISVATGRPYDLALPAIRALSLSGPGVFNGGAEIVDMVTGTILSSQLLEVPALQDIIRLALPFGYDIFTDDSQYAQPALHPEDADKPTAKILIEAVAIRDALGMLEQLRGVPTASPHTTSSWSDGDVVDIHVTHELATKRHGAEQLMAMLGFNREQVIAVGDGHNDIPLLEAAGLKVAMGNAPDEVKALADYVAPSLADDGVADVIERYVLR